MVHYINIFMKNPAYLEMRLVCVFGEDNKVKGYISGDGEKIFEYIGNDLNEVLRRLEILCMTAIEG